MQPTVIELRTDQQLTGVTKERFSRGSCYVAHDRRRQYLFVAQRVDFLRDAISDRCHEELSRSFLYASASPQYQNAYHGSFNLDVVSCEDTPAYVEQHRFRYQTVLLATLTPRHWVVVQVPVKNIPAVEQDDDRSVVGGHSCEAGVDHQKGEGGEKGHSVRSV